MVMDCALPVSRSFADTVRMPFASMSNVILDLQARQAGAQLDALQLDGAVDLLSFAMGRSPCSTWISTLVWNAAAVLNTCE